MFFLYSLFFKKALYNVIAQSFIFVQWFSHYLSTCINLYVHEILQHFKRPIKASNTNFTHNTFIFKLIHNNLLTIQAYTQ